MRVAEVARLLIKGNSREDIVQFSASIWKIAERQTDKYIQRANEQIENSIKRNVNRDYAIAILRYAEIYKIAMEKQQLKTALSAIKEMTALQGLLKIPIDLGQDDEYYLHSLTDEQLEAEISKYRDCNK